MYISAYTTHNFRSFAVGHRGVSYVGTDFFFIDDYGVIGGDFQRNDGSGGWSVYGETFRGMLYDLVFLYFKILVCRWKLEYTSWSTRASNNGKYGKKGYEQVSIHHYHAAETRTRQATCRLRRSHWRDGSYYAYQSKVWLYERLSTSICLYCCGRRMVKSFRAYNVSRKMAFLR